MPGTLYIVPTPVGNMGDMTPRAIEVLKAVSAVLAEDTRTTAPLLKRFGIATPLRSHHKYNEHGAVAGLVEELRGGADLALVSDAGTPGVSDPGFMLSRECRRNDIPVITLPGATAVIPALVSSGLPCDRFCFEGFLPPKKGRATRLREIAAEKRTTVIYESPLRLVKTLGELAEVCGPDRPASVSREISKLHEETRRGSLYELVQYFTLNNPRGEIVIVLGGDADEGNHRPHKNKYKDNSVNNN